MSKPGFRVFTQIHRPSRDLVSALGDMPVAVIADEMGRMFCLDPGIRPLNKARMAGAAITVRARPGCNLMLQHALDLAQPGDVVVVEGQGDESNALAGENMMLWAERRGLGGVVIDGAIRDVDTLSQMTFPVYARGVTPRGPYKTGPGEINVPIQCGSVVVQPGDIVVGDADGVVVVSKADAQGVLANARKKLDYEVRAKREIADGTWSRTRYSAQALSEMGCEIVEAAWSLS